MATLKRESKRKQSTWRERSEEHEPSHIPWQRDDAMGDHYLPVSGIVSAYRHDAADGRPE